jgi:hypothetical protein
VVCLSLESVRKKSFDYFNIQHFERVWNLVDRSIGRRYMETGCRRAKADKNTKSSSLVTLKMCRHNIESGPSAQWHWNLCWTYDQSRYYMCRCVSSCSHTTGCVTRPNKRFWSSISQTFLSTHTRSYVNIWHEKVSGSLETSLFFVNVLHSSHAQGCLHSFDSDQLFAMSHAKIYEQNKTRWHMNFRTHTTNKDK